MQLYVNITNRDWLQECIKFQILSWIQKYSNETLVGINICDNIEMCVES